MGETESVGVGTNVLLGGTLFSVLQLEEAVMLS